MIVHLHYLAPVILEVDVSVGCVTRVVIDAENATPERTRTASFPGGPPARVPQRVIVALAARTIAEEKPWPRWEFGW